MPRSLGCSFKASSREELIRNLAPKASPTHLHAVMSFKSSTSAPSYQPVTQIEPSAYDTHQVQHASLSWIYVLCIANFGLSGAWALEFAITTPYFEKALKSGRVISHFVWIVGPLSGLIVAPIVGTLSDRCTHPMGRRRPFIIAGLIATIVGMLTFSNAPQLASLLFGSESESLHASAIAIAIVSFCILDLAINTTMWPVRALQGDLIPKSQQHVVQSATMVMGSLGDLAANSLVNYFEEPVSQIRLSFLAAAVVFSSTIILLLFVGKENALDPEDGTMQPRKRDSLNLFDFLRGLPGWMWRVGGVYALGFFALFCCMPNASHWLGSSVLRGNPDAAGNSADAKKYEGGVRIYGRASLVRAVLQIIFSAAYPWLLKTIFTEGQLLALCFGIFGVLVAIFGGTNSIPMAFTIIVVLALPMAALFTLPTGMTLQNSDKSNTGRYLGALNCFAVIPQLIDTLYTGFVSRKYGEAAVMRIGAAWAILTTVGALLYMKG